MDSLIANFPKIWKLEGKFEEGELGNGKFQCERDLLDVLNYGPYHFDGWKVSLVRWEPVVRSSYPSAITFWVKVGDIPMHLWEEVTIRAVGKALGDVKEVEEDSGSVLVTIDGFKPLRFKVLVPFEHGEEIVVSLTYDKLSGYCKHCNLLTHEVAKCPDLVDSRKQQERDQVVMVREGTVPDVSRRLSVKRALDMELVDIHDKYRARQDAVGLGGRGETYAEKLLRGDGQSGASRGNRSKVYKGVNYRKPSKEARVKEGSSSHVMQKHYSSWPKPLYDSGDSSKQVHGLLSDAQKQSYSIADKGKEIDLGTDGVNETSQQVPIGKVVEDEDLLVEDGEMIGEELLGDDQRVLALPENDDDLSVMGQGLEEDNGLHDLHLERNDGPVDAVTSTALETVATTETLASNDGIGKKREDYGTKGGTRDTLLPKTSKKGMVAPLKPPAQP